MNADDNTTIHDTDIDALIRHLLSGPVDPDRQFLSGADTFARIYALANQIQTVLAHQERTNRPVCLCSDNHTLVAAALLAALKGGPALILPYAYSKQALIETKQAFDFGVALVDDARPLPQDVTAIDLQIIEAAPETGTTRQIRTQNDDWIYLFTGGSTGQPKTWTKTPGNLLAEALYLVHEFEVSDNDVILATVPPNHIYGLLYSVLVPLLASAEVFPHTPSFPNEIIKLMANAGITILVSIPAHYRALKSHPVERHNLRIALSSAGALAPEDDQAFFQSMAVSITEVYGSTETGGIALRCRTAGQPGLTPYSCVDWQIRGTALHVRSAFLSPELETSDDGFFQTADRAQSDDRGGFSLLGRSDGIVKVAGKRVDLVKIQQTLQQISGVSDAYVFAKKIGRGRENEILALVAGDVTIESLRVILQQQLEPYSQPRTIQVVAQIPVSSVGKYNRVEIERLFA